MRKFLVITMLGSLTALLGIGVAAASNNALDLGLDANRLFFKYQAPSDNLQDLQMLPNTQHNPLLLPCDLQVFGGQLDISYDGKGPTVYPRVSFAFYDPNGTQLTSKGYSGTASLGTIDMDVQAMTAGTRQSDGYTPLDSIDLFRDWQFQPADLPADMPVRMHMNVTAWADQARTQALLDANGANDARDVWIQRDCSCM